MLRGIIQHLQVGQVRVWQRASTQVMFITVSTLLSKIKGNRAPARMKKAQDVEPQNFGHRHFDPLAHGLLGGGERENQRIQRSLKSKIDPHAFAQGKIAIGILRRAMRTT